MIITNLDRTLPAGVVYTAHWRAELTDGSHTVSCYGTVDLPQGDPESPDFVPYDELTEEIVLDWTIEALGQENLDAIDAYLVQALEDAQHPRMAHGVPWSATQPEPVDDPTELDL
jgi:hypothetical protein